MWPPHATLLPSVATMVPARPSVEPSEAGLERVQKPRKEGRAPSQEFAMEGTATAARHSPLALALALVAALLVSSALTGCNTMRGAGQDLENAGEEVEDAAQ
jgi:predicted small secreted protein